MSSPTPAPSAPHRALKFIFAGIILGWLVTVFLHLYFFAYASMDSWCYAAPAVMARAPFHIITPFLGAFEGADRAWGLHWPGGLLLTSIFAPLLPRCPATYVSIYIAYWLLACLATAALARRLTSSSWLALAAFLLVAGDRNAFGDTWFQRYEMLGGAICIAAILALCDRQDKHPGLRSATIGGAFFLLPLIHPVFSGLGFGWLVYLGFETVVLRQPWRKFWIAAVPYGAGWTAFLGYYWSRPWLYKEFLTHAQENVELTRVSAPPGLRTFLSSLWVIDTPTRSGTVLYIVALGGAFFLLYGFMRSRRDWREFLATENAGIFTALGLIGALILSQLSYNHAYWTTSWPFAAAMACQVAHRLAQSFPRHRRLALGALVALLLLHDAYLPGRTYLWHKYGFVNLRGQLREFADSLPKGGQVFVPEVLWDTYAGGNQEAFMNSLPYFAGDAAEKRYASYITARMQPGDVVVIDALQGRVPRIDPHQPGWKEIGRSKLVYQGDHPHGYDLTAYQKE
jgi:hypothetical protein